MKLIGNINKKCILGNHGTFNYYGCRSYKNYKSIINHILLASAGATTVNAIVTTAAIAAAPNHICNIILAVAIVVLFSFILYLHNGFKLRAILKTVCLLNGSCDSASMM